MMIIKKLGLMVISTLLLFGCMDSNNIPHQEISLVDPLQQRLEELSLVTLKRNRTFFNKECGKFGAGKTGHHLFSGLNNFRDDYAKWKCYEVSFLKCPDFNITPSDGKALINVTRGGVEDYSKDQLKWCVAYAIILAPTELKPTSIDVKNRDSWLN